MNWTKIGLGLFFALGGVGILLTAADRLIPELVGAIILKVMTLFPGARAFIIEHAAEIKKIAEDSEKALEKAVDNAKGPTA